MAIYYQSGYTFLHRAARKGNADIAELLLNKGVGIDEADDVSYVARTIDRIVATAVREYELSEGLIITLILLDLDRYLDRFDVSHFIL